MALAPAITINLPGIPFDNLTSTATIATLRALPSAGNAQGDNIAVDGSVAIGDGGGGLYVWDDLSVLNDDGVTIIKPTDIPPLSAGRWILTASDLVEGVFTALAAPSGSSLVGWIQSGVGAFARTVLDKLRETMLSRNDFTLEADFNTAAAASPTKPTLDGSGNFGAKITPTGESQSALKDMVRPVADGPRDSIIYGSATSVKVFRNNAVMGGFRFRGTYTKTGRQPVFPMPAVKSASTATGNVSLSSTKLENWYGVFACADSGDSEATLVVMPFLRIAAPVGSVAGLIKAGEGVSDLVTTTSYSWTSANNLAGVDCLVIAENENWSGRVTTITANSASSITLTTIGTLAAGDFLLPAPPGFDHYVYLGSFYFDTAEVRNIYDTGSIAKAKMINLLSPNISSGAFPAPVPPAAGGANMLCRGYISPLATGIIVDTTTTLSTNSVGTYAEYYDGDGGGHVVQSFFAQKVHDPGTLTVVFTNAQVPFLYHQKFNWGTGGSLEASGVGRTMAVTGWFEP